MTTSKTLENWFDDWTFVALNGLDHILAKDMHDEWLSDTFGFYGGKWNRCARDKLLVYGFKHPRDAMIFMLMYGGTITDAMGKPEETK